MKQILNRLFEHESLSRDEAAAVMTNIAAGEYNESQIAAFISVYLMRSIELEEVIGFRDALLQLAIPMDLSEFDPLDIVGTGGDGKIPSIFPPAVALPLPVRVTKWLNMGITAPLR